MFKTMEYNVISTGSKGNAVTINNFILIDCGVPFKSLRDVYTDIKIVLLTHIHSDHFKKPTIRRLAKERPTLRFACGEWLVRPLTECGVSASNIDILNHGNLYDYGKFKVSPVVLYHDVPNFGYRLFFRDKKVFYATDTNTLDGITAKGYDLYLVEANYIDEDIQAKIKEKQEKGQFSYELGVLNTHLSKKKCDEFIYSNIEQNGMYVYLHQHEERSD